MRAASHTTQKHGTDWYRTRRYVNANRRRRVTELVPRLEAEGHLVNECSLVTMAGSSSLAPDGYRGKRAASIVCPGSERLRLRTGARLTLRLASAHSTTSLACRRRVPLER